MEHHAKQNEDTKQRLLDTAEALFAEKGYYAVSVREITNAAGTHLSAVNYHFNDKRNLYLEVFRSRVLPRGMLIFDQVKKSLGEDTTSPSGVIRAVAKAFLAMKMDRQEEWLRHHQLMARELASPSEALDLMLQEVQIPLYRMVGERLTPYLPPEERAKLPLMLLSVSGQIMHFSLARQLVGRLTGKPYDHELVDELVEHIVEFSLKGMGINGKEGAYGPAAA